MWVKNNRVCYKLQPSKTNNIIIIRKHLKYLIFIHHSLTFQNAMKTLYIEKTSKKYSFQIKKTKKA
jgi:hypothetical protein